METSIKIIILGIFIFWGHYLSGFFERRNIPDVLGLMFTGILLGPVFHIAEPGSFGQFGSLFSNLVLIFILFESGTDLKISEVKESFRDSAGITTFGFLTTWIVAAILCNVIFDLSTLSSLFIGATIGGTSSAVVVGLVRKVKVLPKTTTTLIIESAQSDIFTLAIPLGILGLMLTGELEAAPVISQFVASLVLALFIGIFGAFLWSFILGKFPTLKATRFATPAFLFILYGIAEYLRYSGPLTALSFGVAIGNIKYFEPRLLARIIPDHAIVLPQREKEFFSQIVFLLRTFFFVFIGISVQIERLDWLAWGAVITLLLFAVRLVLVRFVFSRETPLLDKSVISTMIPKGLGSAVIATLPIRNDHPDGLIIQSICFSIILFSTIYCAGLFYLIKSGFILPFYSLVYGRDLMQTRKT